MNPGGSLKIIDVVSLASIKSNIEPSVQNQHHLQKDGQLFMCEKFVQSHWANNGMLLAEDGEKLYGAEMRDQNNECLSIIKKELISDTTTVLFNKDVEDNDNHCDQINLCSDVTPAIVPDTLKSLSMSNDSSLTKKHSKTIEPSRTLRSLRKNNQLILNSPIKKKSASKLLKDGHQRSTKIKQKALVEKTFSQKTIALRNEPPPVISDYKIKAKLHLRNNNLYTPNCSKLRSESDFILRPNKDRRYPIVPLNKSRPKPVCTQISKRLPHMKKCSVIIKRLKISKPSILDTCGIKKQNLEQRNLQINNVDFKVERVNASVQCQPKKCDSITQTYPMVKAKLNDFSCQTSIPDSANAAKISALELAIRDLKHELNVRQAQHEKNVLALRACLSVEQERTNGSNVLLTESQLNHNNKTSQMDVNSEIPHSLLPRQPQRTVARSLTIKPTSSNQDKASFRQQIVKPSILTLSVRQSSPYAQSKEPEKQFRFQRTVARSSSVRPTDSIQGNAIRKQIVKPSILTLPLRQSYPSVHSKQPEKQFRFKQPQS